MEAYPIYYKTVWNLVYTMTERKYHPGWQSTAWASEPEVKDKCEKCGEEIENHSYIFVTDEDEILCADCKKKADAEK